MTTDTRFITNENGQSLVERFTTLIGRDTTNFDCLVGYFYSSGFHLLKPALDKTQKIRVLIGLSTNKETFDLIQRGNAQQELSLSHAETKDVYAQTVVSELNEVEETKKIETGVRAFIEWISQKKLEIRAFPTANLHAKMYIMTHEKGSRDKGRVVTGSSNFSVSGLKGNLELNVELKDAPDYDFAIKKFNELWDQSVDVSDRYVQTVQSKTWLNDAINPYDLYLKCLYEYFQDEINQFSDDDAFSPVDFMKLAYQEEAVTSARQIIRKYGGVFLSDVVGLGKTFISALLAQRLRSDGRILVLAPPHVLDRNNQGSWPNVFYAFDVSARFESIGQLDKVLQDGTDGYKTVFIDEAHRFRSDDTETYAKLAQVCFGKQVVLVTATPYNNRPSDILSLIKLFQKPYDSTIPNVRNLQNFFAQLENKAKKHDRKTDYENYIKAVKENARSVRENVLKHLMVRRTRAEVTRFFRDDIEQQGLTFPEVEKPEPLFYKLNEKEEAVFSETLRLMKLLTFARYTPLLYSKEPLRADEMTGQRNMKSFMKTLLIKRMDSSIAAFRSTLDRFLRSHEMFLKAYEKGSVYFSKNHVQKIFDALELDNDEAVEKLLESGKAEKRDVTTFDERLKIDLEADLHVIKSIIGLWNGIQRDPKVLEFLHQLKTRKTLQKAKIVLFTEAEVTAKYLKEKLEAATSHRVLVFSGHSSAADRSLVIDNFDAKARNAKDDFDILVTTEVLAEGVNLHRSNVIINYDIPWNPTRLMQRVGRINRVGTAFDKIYTFNFFPTKEINDQLGLQEAAVAKIESFIEMLGADAKLLTESEDVGPRGLFQILNSKTVLEDEEDAENSELKYLRIIQTIRDEQPALFEKIRTLPRKARSSRAGAKGSKPRVLTYFRKGYLTKFLLSDTAGTKEIDFIHAAKTLECSPDSRKFALSENDQEMFYTFFEHNKDGFASVTNSLDDEETEKRGSRSALTKLREFVKIVRKDSRLTDSDTDYLKDVMAALDIGVLPKKTAALIVKKIEDAGQDILKMLAIIRTNIDPTFLQADSSKRREDRGGKREVVLSLYQKAE